MDLIFLRIRKRISKNVFSYYYCKLCIKKRTPPKILSISWSSSSSLSASMLSLKNCFFFLQQANITSLPDMILVNHTLAITVAPATQIMLIPETTTAVVHIDIRVKIVTTILLVINFRMTFFLDDLVSFQCNILS